MVVVEGVADTERVRRQHLDPAALGADADRSGDGDRTARSREAHPPRRAKQIHEGLGAAIGRRHFRPVDVHHQVVDAERRRRRHEVLDRAHLHPERADRGRGIAIDDVIGVRGDQRAVRSPEQDPGIRRGGRDRHLDCLTRVQPDPVEASRVSDGLLGIHSRGLSRQARCQ